MAKRRDEGVPTTRQLEWQRVLAEHERSGLSVAEFARRHGISPGSLGWWRYIARRRAAERSGTETRTRVGRAAQGKFVEVRVEPEQGVEIDVMRGGFEVVLPGGCVVRVPAHFEAAALRRLLATLGAPC
jgi:transposase-like protein